MNKEDAGSGAGNGNGSNDGDDMESKSSIWKQRPFEQTALVV